MADKLASLTRLGKHQDELQPVTHFRQLHLQSIARFEERITTVARRLDQTTVDDNAHDELHDLLHRYSEAVDDLERMNLRPPIPHAIPSSDPSDEDLEAKSAASQLPLFETVGVLSPKAPKAFTRIFEALSEPLNFALNTIIQLIFAGTMGAALVTPMLIMVLHPSRENSLIVTCVFVFAFASALVLFNVMAYLARMSLASLGLGRNVLEGSILQVKDIVGATAAYAAVLVVFVGTSTSIR